jgi:hypothetical protein
LLEGPIFETEFQWVFALGAARISKHDAIGRLDWELTTWALKSHECSPHSEIVSNCLRNVLWVTTKQSPQKREWSYKLIIEKRREND